MEYQINSKGNFAVVNISGDLELGDHYKQMNEAIAQWVDKGFKNFVFNLHGLTYLDSSGISIFIERLCDAEQKNGTVSVIAEEPRIREILDLVGLSRMIKIYERTEDFEKENLMKGAVP